MLSEREYQVLKEIQKTGSVKKWDPDTPQILDSLLEQGLIEPIRGEKDKGFRDFYGLTPREMEIIRYAAKREFTMKAIIYAESFVLLIWGIIRLVYLLP